MVFRVQLCFKSRDGLLYWKITVIIDYRVQCNSEGLQHCFYTSFKKNCGLTKVCDIFAMYSDQESVHQSLSKMTWTEYGLLLFTSPQRVYGWLKDDSEMVKWWQFTSGQWITFLVCLCVHFCWQKVALCPYKSKCYLALVTDSSFTFTCTFFSFCLRNKYVDLNIDLINM